MLGYCLANLTRMLLKTLLLLAALLGSCICAGIESAAVAETGTALNSFEQWIRQRRSVGRAECCSADDLDKLEDNLQEDLDTLVEN